MFTRIPRCAIAHARTPARRALAGAPEGQLLAILIMAVMAVELAIGFALVVAVYRKRQADVIEALGTMKQ